MSYFSNGAIRGNVERIIDIKSYPTHINDILPPIYIYLCPLNTSVARPEIFRDISITVFTAMVEEIKLHSFSSELRLTSWTNFNFQPSDPNLEKHSFGHFGKLRRNQSIQTRHIKQDWHGTFVVSPWTKITAAINDWCFREIATILCFLISMFSFVDIINKPEET